MKYVQALLAFVAITSVSARALPGDSTLALREALPYLDDQQLASREPKKGKAAANGTTSATKATKSGKAKKSKSSSAASATATALAARDAKQDLTSGDLSSIDSIVEGLTGKDPGLKGRTVEVINAAHFPDLASRKKHNGTSTNDAQATGTAAAAAKASKKAAKSAAKASKAAAASATASAAAVRRDADSFPELESRKKHNGTATTNNAATITDPAALASKSAAKASKKAAKSAAKASKAAAASATASAAAVRRDVDSFPELESRKKHNGTATTNNAATITDPAALASKSAAKASKKAAKSAKKASAAAAASATASASAAAVKREFGTFPELETRKKHNGTATTNNAATITDPAALASKSAAKAAKKAAKSSKKAAAAAASATASAAAVKRDFEIIADMNRRRSIHARGASAASELDADESEADEVGETLETRFHSKDTRITIAG